MALDKESERLYLTFRVAIASGLFASLGATLGWLIWLSAKVPFSDLATAVMSGVLVGLTVHWGKHYLHVALHERVSTSTGDQATDGFAKPTSPGTAALVWAAGFGLLGLASEHLVADLAAKFMVPMLASLATLLPAGVILGVSLHLGNKDERTTLQRLIRGLGVGASVAIVTGAVWWVGWGVVPWFALFSWWILVAIGIQFFVPAEEHGVRFYQPVCGVAVAFVLVVLLSLLPGSASLYERLGFLGGPALLARDMAYQVIDSPGLPATFWLEAMDRAQRAQAVESTQKPSARDGSGSSSVSAPNLDRYVPPSAGANTPGSVRRVSEGERSKSPSEGAANLQRALDEFKSLGNSVRRSRPQNPWLALNRQSNHQPRFGDSWNHIVAEFHEGLASPLVCSWLILLLFAVAMGLAPAVEAALRPPDYPSSATFKKDVTISVALMLAVIAACICARLTSPSDGRGLPATNLQSN